MKKAYPYIRWSSKIQEAGNSERRQRELIEQSKEWLNGLGYVLDESMNLIDKAESAFTGIPPSLARFFKAVETGEVKSGSMLALEAQDRFSRDDPETVVIQFLTLKRKGVSIGILNKREVFGPGDDWTKLIFFIMGTVQPHGESVEKKKRLLSVWKEKRRKAVEDGIRSKHKCPYWLRWDDGTKLYVKIPEAVKAVLHVYELKLKGWGAIRISKEMNRLKIWMPLISKGNKTGMWNTSYVNRCLRRNETPIGTFSPHLRIKEKQPDGKVKVTRPPACDPILNYYPSIFTPDEEHKFYEVQRIMDLVGSLPGKGGGGWRNDKESNVFKGIIRCGLCNGSVSYVDKTGKKSKNPKEYLQCAKARENHQCTAPPINYNELLKLFFEYINELTVQDILPTPKEQDDRIQELDLKIKSGEQYLRTLVSQSENLLQAFGNSKDLRSQAKIDKRLTDVNNEIERIEKTIKQSEEELKSAKVEAEKLQAILNTSNDLYRKLKDMPEGPEKVEFRKRIRTEIRELVDHIVIYYPSPQPPQIDLEKEGEYHVLESGLVETMAKQVRIVFRAGRMTTISKTLFLRNVWEINR